MTRILLKVSGEMLGVDGRTASLSALQELARGVRLLQERSFEVAMVVGGGNIWRYRDFTDLDLHPASSDALGMLATQINARLIQDFCRQAGLKATAFAAHANPYFMEEYAPFKVQEALTKGDLVILGGGTGNPFFTTDTTSVLRALELSCDVFLKATKVDGVYSEDPEKNPSAQRFDQITYKEVLDRKLGVMDLTAVTLADERQLPIRVFSWNTADDLVTAALGQRGTLIHS